MWQVSHLNAKIPNKVCAHQEDTKTDKYCHGVNEWLAHEPAFSIRIVSGLHVAASDMKVTASKTVKTAAYPLLVISRSHVWILRGG